ncbi:MAG TPA: hypothetical protein VEU96_12520 [Bryobacteraceae bacterium]|nr:hypothetical protein [Bryobacteraceae bacterium]
MKHLSRLLIVLGVTALVLIAEDFWVKKPYTDWSEKDAAKLLNNSPWSHDVALSSPTVDSGVASASGGGRGGPRSGAGENPGGNGMNDPSTGADGGIGGGGGGRRGGGGGGMGEINRGQGGASMTLHVRWQSALPIREALVVTKLGHEKAESDQAKKFLDQTLPYYVVAVVGLPPGLVARMRDEQLPELAKATTLVRKDKDPIAAEGAQRLPGEPGIAFLFPKTAAIALEDKEVEFVSKVGPIEVKRKFKLKDMVIGDKLAL